MLGMKW